MRGGGGFLIAVIGLEEEEAGETGEGGEVGGVGREAFGIRIVTCVSRSRRDNTVRAD